MILRVLDNCFMNKYVIVIVVIACSSEWIELK